jgi:Cu2+-exporting ATPase
MKDIPEPAPANVTAGGTRAIAQGTLDVVRVRADWVRVACEGVDELSVRRFTSWCAGRGEVMEVSTRAAGGEFVEVRFTDDPRTPGAFVRSLRDWIFAESQPVARGRLTIDVTHLLSGRVRFRLNVDEDDVGRVAAFARTLPGVVRVNASPVTRSLLVAFDPEQTNAGKLIDVISSSDPDAWPTVVPPTPKHGVRRTLINSAVLAAAATGVVPPPIIGTAVALTAIPSVQRTFRALREKRLSVDLLDVVAVGMSIGTGAPATGAFITWLLGIGDVILEKTNDTARNAIAHVLKLDAVEATVVRDGKLKRVKAKDLKIGDEIVVEPGGCIAADGVVARGSALVDEKALTGESIPHHKNEGAQVLAATVVVEGELVVRVERVGTDTTAAKIVQILEGAGAKPMTLQRETEKVADRLVLPTFGIAGAAATIGGAIDSATSVLITDFGTGIRVAVPIAALTAITLAAREGVLVKGGQFLERLSKVDTIVFDKTGTLTGGTPEVFEVVPVGRASIADVVRLAAAAESRQRHPVAEAIRKYASRARVEVPEPEMGSAVYTVGFGVSARIENHEVLVGGERFMRARGVRMDAATPIVDRHQQAGASSVVVAVDDQVFGVIGYADQPRSESKRVVEALQRGGRRRVVLMSGDGRRPVQATAAAVGVDHAYWEMLPEDKANRVRELQREGRVVAMIGDGINDAPALAVADVGISLEGGTDVALETADVVLLEGGLLKLPDAFDAADAAMRRVRRSLGLIVVPNAVAIVLGAVGLLPPTIAAVINNGSTVLAALAGVAPLLRPRPR